MSKKKENAAVAPPAENPPSVAELWALIRAVAAQQQKTTAMVAALSADIRALAEGDEKTRKRIGEAEEARGLAAEVMFRHALPAALKKAGLGDIEVEPRRLRREDREYDLVARNGKANFIGEVKVRFKKKHLAQLMRLLAKFRKDYPAKAGERAVYGVVCGLVVDEEAAEIARNEGLLVVEGRAAAELRVHPRRLMNYAE